MHFVIFQAQGQNCCQDKYTQCGIATPREETQRRRDKQFKCDWKITHTHTITLTWAYSGETFHREKTDGRNKKTKNENNATTNADKRDKHLLRHRFDLTDWEVKWIKRDAAETERQRQRTNYDANQTKCNNAPQCDNIPTKRLRQ